MEVVEILVLAHRGYSHIYPENTMLAFRKALEAGADGIETDVQVTKDGVLVLIHDDDVSRVSDGTGRIKDLTYEELLKFDFGIMKGPQFKGEKIPTLQELLDLVKDKDILLNIEIKYGSFLYEGIEEKTYRMVKKNGLLEKVIFSSFNHYSCHDLKEIDRDCKTGILYSDGIYKPYKYAEELPADAIHPYRLLVNKQIVDACHRRNIKVNVWTVDDFKEAKMLMDMGVDCIMTNKPKEMMEFLGVGKHGEKA